MTYEYYHYSLADKYVVIDVEVKKTVNGMKITDFASFDGTNAVYIKNPTQDQVKNNLKNLKKYTHIFYKGGCFETQLMEIHAPILLPKMKNIENQGLVTVPKKLDYYIHIDHNAIDECIFYYYLQQGSPEHARELVSIVSFSEDKYQDEYRTVNFSLKHDYLCSTYAIVLSMIMQDELSGRGIKDLIWAMENLPDEEVFHNLYDEYLFCGGLSRNDYYKYMTKYSNLKLVKGHACYAYNKQIRPQPYNVIIPFRTWDKKNDYVYGLPSVNTVFLRCAHALALDGDVTVEKYNLAFADPASKTDDYLTHWNFDEVTHKFTIKDDVSEEYIKNINLISTFHEQIHSTFLIPAHVHDEEIAFYHYVANDKISRLYKSDGQSIAYLNQSLKADQLKTTDIVVSQWKNYLVDTMQYGIHFYENNYVMLWPKSHGAFSWSEEIHTGLKRWIKRVSSKHDIGTNHLDYKELTLSPPDDGFCALYVSFLLECFLGQQSYGCLYSDYLNHTDVLNWSQEDQWQAAIAIMTNKYPDTEWDNATLMNESLNGYCKLLSNVWKSPVYHSILGINKAHCSLTLVNPNAPSLTTMLDAKSTLLTFPFMSLMWTYGMYARPTDSLDALAAEIARGHQATVSIVDTNIVNKRVVRSTHYASEGNKVVYKMFIKLDPGTEQFILCANENREDLQVLIADKDHHVKNGPKDLEPVVVLENPPSPLHEKQPSSNKYATGLFKVQLINFETNQICLETKLDISFDKKDIIECFPKKMQRVLCKKFLSFVCPKEKIVPYCHPNLRSINDMMYVAAFSHINLIYREKLLKDKLPINCPLSIADIACKWHRLFDFIGPNPHLQIDIYRPKKFPYDLEYYSDHPVEEFQNKLKEEELGWNVDILDEALPCIVMNPFIIMNETNYYEGCTEYLEQKMGTYQTAFLIVSIYTREGTYPLYWEEGHWTRTGNNVSVSPKGNPSAYDSPVWMPHLKRPESFIKNQVNYTLLGQVKTGDYVYQCLYKATKLANPLPDTISHDVEHIAMHDAALHFCLHRTLPEELNINTVLQCARHITIQNNHSLKNIDNAQCEDLIKVSLDAVCDFQLKKLKTESELMLANDTAPVYKVDTWFEYYPNLPYAFVKKHHVDCVNNFYTVLKELWGPIYLFTISLVLSLAVSMIFSPFIITPVMVVGIIYFTGTFFKLVINYCSVKYLLYKTNRGEAAGDLWEILYRYMFEYPMIIVGSQIPYVDKFVETYLAAPIGQVIPKSFIKILENALLLTYLYVSEQHKEFHTYKTELWIKMKNKYGPNELLNVPKLPNLEEPNAVVGGLKEWFQVKNDKLTAKIHKTIDTYAKYCVLLNSEANEEYRQSLMHELTRDYDKLSIMLRLAAQSMIWTNALPLLLKKQMIGVSTTLVIFLDQMFTNINLFLSNIEICQNPSRTLMLYCSRLETLSIHNILSLTYYFQYIWYGICTFTYLFFSRLSIYFCLPQGDISEILTAISNPAAIVFFTMRTIIGQRFRRTCVKEYLAKELDYWRMENYESNITRYNIAWMLIKAQFKFQTPPDFNQTQFNEAVKEWIAKDTTPHQSPHRWYHKQIWAELLCRNAIVGGEIEYECHPISLIIYNAIQEPCGRTIQGDYFWNNIGTTFYELKQKMWKINKAVRVAIRTGYYHRRRNINTVDHQNAEVFASLFSRHTSTRLEPDPVILQDFALFVEQWMKEVFKYGKVSNFEYTTPEQYLASIEPIRRPIYEKGYEQGKRGYYKEKFEIMSKGDEVNFKEIDENRARNLFNPSEFIKMWGGFLNENAINFLKSIIGTKGNMTNPKSSNGIFVHGLNCSDLEDAMHNIVLLDPSLSIALATDGSAHDAHQRASLLKVVDTVFWKIFMSEVIHQHWQDDPLLFRQMNQFLQKIDYSVVMKDTLKRAYQTKVFKGEIHGTTFTGSPTLTTFGNTLRVILYHLYIAKKANVKINVAVAGDDSLFFINPKDLEKFKSHFFDYYSNTEPKTDTMFGLGQVAKMIEVCGRSVNFLSKIGYITADNEVRLHRVPQRFIFGGHTSFKISNIFTKEDHAQAILDGLIAAGEHLPFVCPSFWADRRKYAVGSKRDNILRHNRTQKKNYAIVVHEHLHDSEQHWEAMNSYATPYIPYGLNPFDEYAIDKFKYRTGLNDFIIRGNSQSQLHSNKNISFPS